METSLYSYLSTYAGLVSLVSTRIYPIDIPQDKTYPCVAYEMASSPRVHAMGSDPGLKYPRYNFYCWGSTPASARAVAAQVIAALQDFTGTMGTVSVQRIFLEDEYDGDFDPMLNRYCRVVEVIIWVEE